MAQRLLIWTSVREAYKSLYIHRFEILKIMWLPLLLILLPVFNTVVMLYPDIRYIVSSQAHKYLADAWYGVISAIGLVAVFRFLILEEAPRYTILNLRRDSGRSPWLILPLYFRVTRNVFWYAGLSIAMMFLFKGLSDAYLLFRTKEIEALVLNYMDLPKSDPIFYYKYILNVLSAALCAWLMLWWSYLAIVPGAPQWQRLKDLVGLVKGNVIRIMLIAFLIYLPYEIFSSMLNAVLNIVSLTADNGNEMIAQVLASHGNEILFINDQITMIVFVMCAVAEVAFIAMVWKSAIVRKDA